MTVNAKPSEYYVLIRPWQVYVKEGRFFRNQGGLTQEWGKSWERIEAVSVENAREIGKVMQAKRKAELSAPAPEFPVQSELRVVNRAPDGEFICVMGSQGPVGMDLEPVAPASPEFRGVYTLPEKQAAIIAAAAHKRDPWYVTVFKGLVITAVTSGIGYVVGTLVRILYAFYHAP